ncbi:hypothetical protein C2U72_15570 [Prosthecomicrobium hirschii]|nr:hypothetical protein C2U72_15570 [Prosthecomicrobium hirschii]
MTMKPPVRLRQICMVVETLEPVLDRLIDVFGLTVCHGKGDLSHYGVPYREPPPYQAAFFKQHGVTGALLPIGDDFLELIAPLRADTPAARYLARRGEGGYMVITETDDTGTFQARASREGVRLAGTADYPTYHEVQMDPRDIGGAILSFSMQREGRPFDGGWFPAGADWQARRAPGWQAIASATLTVAEPDRTAARWSSLIGAPVAPDADRGTAIRLDKGMIRFEPAPGAGGRLTAIGLAGPAFGAAYDRAKPDERVENGRLQNGRLQNGRAIRIAGLTFEEASSWR